VCRSEQYRFGEEDEKFMNARLRLLDCFQLACDGRQVALPMSAQRLLAYLALHPHPLRRVHVAGALWLDSPEERAFASLRSALWRLQQAGGELVQTRDSQLGLHPCVRVDYREAACLSRALLDATSAEPRPEVEWGMLAGELLPDWDDDWVIVEREHHRHLSLQAMEALSDRLLATGTSAQALEIALAVFAREPLRETAHRLMIRVHIAEGNSFEAIRQYRLYERLTLTRIGLPPSAQMDALVRDLLPSGLVAPGAAA
jgi:DNA-binding SARP family transcriptional activator